MLSFFKGNYSKREIYLLRYVLEDAQYFLKTSWTECETYGEKICCECYARHVCKDLDRIINHLSYVENPVGTVDN